MPRARSQSRSAGREGLAADRGLAQRRQRDARLVGLFERDAQEARRAGVGVGAQLGHRLQLQLGVAHAARKDRAADGVRAGFHHRAGRREVVAEAVVHQVAGAKAGGEQRAAEAPVVGAMAFGFVDRAGRLEHAPRRARRTAARASRWRRSRRRGRCARRAFWRSSSSCLRVTGSCASAAREPMAAASTPRRISPKAGAWPAPRRSAPAARAISAASRSPGRAFPARRRIQSSRSPHAAMPSSGRR